MIKRRKAGVRVLCSQAVATHDLVVCRSDGTRAAWPGGACAAPPGTKHGVCSWSRMQAMVPNAEAGPEVFLLLQVTVSFMSSELVHDGARLASPMSSCYRILFLQAQLTPGLPLFI